MNKQAMTLGGCLAAVAITGALVLSVTMPTLTNAYPTNSLGLPAQEDDPEWDCRIQGNTVCGVDIEGTWYLIEFENGEPVAVRTR